MAHCHDIAAYSIQEEKRGKVYQEEDIFAQVMVEEDLFPEDDGYDVVLSNAVFISPATKPLPTPPAQKRTADAAAAKKTVSMGDGRDDHAQEEDLEEAFFAGSHPATTLGGGNMSTSCPQIPRLSLVPQRSSLADQSGAAVAGVDAHHHHHGDGGDDDGEERGRKVKSPRGEGVDVLGMADDEQVHENHREAAAPARRRLPPGAVGYGQIVPTHFELRKTGGPQSKQPWGGSAEKAAVEKPEFMKVVLANRSAPTSPRSPTYEMDIGSSSSTALHKNATYGADRTGGGSSDASLQATKKWPLGRRRAETDAGRGATAGRATYESFPRPSLGSAWSCTLSRAEQERRVRKESMEYIECPLPPMPEAEWWNAEEGSGAPEQLYADVDIEGDGDELAPSTPKPDGGSIHFGLGKGKHEQQLGSSKSAISYVDEERRRKKCVVQ